MPRLASREAAMTDPSGAAIRAFFRIADLWGLQVDQQRTLLGRPPASTFFQWKREGTGRLSRDVLERISYLLGIFKALEILLPKPTHADSWIRQPNTSPVFGGQTPLDRMLSGNVADLFVVRQYLDASRGWN